MIKLIYSCINKAIFLTCILIAPLLFNGNAGAASDDEAPGLKMAHQATIKRSRWSTTDHSKLKPLQKEFKSGDEITEACLSCHSEAAFQFHKTIHWTWIDPASKGDIITGKAGHSVNNFCISTNGMNDPKCTSCHTGWNGKKSKINCLKCHSNADINWKEAFDDYNYFASEQDEESKQMMADIQKDIQKAAQSIIRPERKNCGACHFKGGGGDGVKHGDMDTSLTNPDKELDVHMGINGQNFKCTRCHTTRLHNVAGRIYATPASDNRKSLIEDDLTSKIMCESCHTDKPHKPGSKPNDHTDKVACQSCHIPKFARKNPTKLWWDWSKSGKLKNGKPYNEEGPLGKHTYMSIKGEMKWGKNVIPEYFWFNGSVHTLTAKDKIDPSQVVKVGWPKGKLGDKKSRIFPFKIHRGKQPYDKVYKTLLTPLLSGPHGYWTTFDWQDAFKRGSAYLNLPYSGKFGFVETTYVFPITHMVAPRENTVKCIECHNRKNSRLSKLKGFYMPGRDNFEGVDFMGWILVLGALAGVGLHGLGRFISRKNGKK